MIDNFYSNALQIKSFDEDNSDQDSLFQIVTEQDILYLECYMQHKPCSQCGQDHSFKPSFDNVQTSIDNALELFLSFFRGPK
jgi:hypothetical protein